MKNFGKFLIGFLAIMVLVGGGFFVWDRYFSSQAKSNRETQKNYEKYLTWQKNYEKAMKEDTFGGKTPEETLQLFIEALKKEDVDLASKYFLLDTNEQPYNRENYLTRNKIIKALKEEKEKGRLQYMAEIISKAVPDPSEPLYNGDYGFVVYEKGEIITEVNMELNKYSGVWKIESL